VIVVLSLSVLAAWAILGTVELTLRDGYRRMPTISMY
jgi:hypothetical protein